MSKATKLVTIKNFKIGQGAPLALFSGPCVIESEEHALECAEKLKAIAEAHDINLIYKSSYDKANRSSSNSFRGPGLEKGLKILRKIKEEFDIPVVTDVHSPMEATAAADVCDVIQIPAFLCRQTDLIIAAGKTGKVIKVKKGQFMAPLDMKNVVDKLLSTGNDQIILTDRGTTFGYNNLITDMRAIPIMQSLGFPVCFDASHSVMLPGGLGTSSGGQREFIPTLTLAAMAAGADCLFIESHTDPANAKSDRETVMAINDLDMLLKKSKEIFEIVQCSNDLLCMQK